jgi:heat shock protein HtpX
MAQNIYTQKDKNVRRTWLLMTMFLVFVTAVGWVFSYALDSPGLFVGALILSLVMNVVSYWYSDKIVLALSNASPVDQKTSEGKEIYRLVENLSITAGIPMPKVYIINDTAMNAFATGRDPEHGVIALTTGIMQRLEKAELEGVIAHELSHIGNRDTLLQTVVVVLVGLVALLSDWFIRISFWGGRRNRDNELDGRLQLVIGIFAIVLAILAPFFAQLIHMAISRRREYLADASGALLTRYPDGLASALAKISQDDELLEVANRATAHMYIINPLRGQGISSMFSTHPPTKNRIEALLGMKIKNSK